MEIKKSPKADLESKKSTWLLVGYVIVLAFMFVAFEWTKRDIKIDTSQAITDLVFEEEIIPITEQPEQVTPPPPEAPAIAETLTIVEDDADVEETAIVSSEELNQAVEIKYVPVAVEEEEPPQAVRAAAAPQAAAAARNERRVILRILMISSISSPCSQQDAALRADIVSGSNEVRFTLVKYITESLAKQSTFTRKRPLLSIASNILIDYFDALFRFC